MLCGQNIEWTTRGRDFFCRPGGSDAQTVWCQPAHPQVPSCFQHLKSHQSARGILLPEFEKRNLWRFLAVDDGREFLLSLDFALMRHEGAAFWLRLNWLDPVFHDLDELMFDKIKASDSLEERLEDGTKDWESALQLFNQKDWWSRVECSKGSIEELRRLVEAYVVVWGNSVNIKSVKDLRLQSLLEVPKNSSSEQKRANQQIVKLLDSHFRLRVKNVAERMYVESGKSVERLELKLNPPSEPTEHDRLEALLVWRDFLRDKMPSEEIEALLQI